MNLSYIFACASVIYNDEFNPKTKIQMMNYYESMIYMG